MTDFVKIGNDFVKYYYQTFDADRSQLSPLYVRREAALGRGRPPARALSLLHFVRCVGK